MVSFEEINGREIYMLPPHARHGPIEEKLLHKKRTQVTLVIR